VNVSGFYEPRHWFASSARLVEAALRYVTGIDGAAEMAELIAGFTLRGAVARIRCPLLTVHGERDVFIPVQEARHIYAEATCAKTLILYPHGDHGLCNTPQARYDVLDWLAQQFRQQASRPVSLAG
jgi:pimeloyl-ACP methyl ester carboxylesterase